MVRSCGVPDSGRRRSKVVRSEEFLKAEIRRSFGGGFEDFGCED